METTLNVHADILEKIAEAAHARGISQSRLIACLFMRVMAEIKSPECIGGMVRYQQRKKKDEWHIFHLQLRVDEYEYFMDLKKLLKMSLSLLLAHAVKKYLCKKIKKKFTDNYPPFQNYIIAKEVIGTIICWKLIWGFPPNLEQYVHF